MKRSLFIATALVVSIILLGLGSIVLQRKAAVQAAGVMAPRFEVDPLWPKPLPNHWIIGQTIGVSVDAQDHIWIIHRAGIARSRENCMRPPNPPAAHVLRARAAGSGVRPGRQSARALGRSGQRLRLAEFEPRNHRRLQRQRLDRRQRPRSAGRALAPSNGSGRRAAASANALASTTT